jgi:hypothetical protein
MRPFLLLLASSALWAQTPAPEPKPEPKKSEEQKPAEAKPADSAPADAAKSIEQPFTGNFEFGYRAIQNVGGDFNTYRSLVNLGEGPRLTHAEFKLDNPSRRFYDRITGTGSGWGDPFNTTRISVFKELSYELTFDYRNVLYYNFLPSFANTLLDRGILIPQRAYDINRRWMEAELRLFPGKKFVPFLAYNRDWGDGTGITNYVANANEYAVFNRLRDKTDRYRGGFHLDLSKLHFSLVQGATTFKDDQRASTADRNVGDRRSPFLGQTLFLTGLNQAYGIRGDSNFTQASMTFTPFSWLDVAGQFLYTKPNVRTTYFETAQGNLVAPGTANFIPRREELFASRAQQPHPSGLVTVEVRPLRGVRILQGFFTDNFRTLRNDLGDLDFSYNRQQIELLVDPHPKFTIRAGHRAVWGTATVRGNQISGLLSEGGKLNQQVGLAGFQLRSVQRLWINADFEKGITSRAYFRTSLYDYTKGSLRVRTQPLKDLNVTWNTLILDNQNPTRTIALDFRQIQNGVSALYSPSGGKRMTILADYFRSSLRSSAGYLIPTDLSEATSIYRENAHTATTLLDFALPGISKAGSARIAAGGTLWHSTGSRPSRFYQPQARVQLPLHAKVLLLAEWRYFGFGQPFYRYETFRTHQFFTGLRFTR